MKQVRIGSVLMENIYKKTPLFSLLNATFVNKSSKERQFQFLGM
jgi:hypothetical protein